MERFRDAIQVLNSMRDEGVIEDYDGVPVKVVKPEYLVALYSEPSARTPRRRERAAMLMELPDLNRALLDEILDRHGLSL